MHKITKPYKKIVAGCMLLLIAIPLFFTILFLVKQLLVQHQMFEKMEQEYVSSYRFSTGDVHWIKEGKELLIKGKLFDVKACTIASDSTSVTGLFDKEEELLKTTFLQIVNSKNEQPTPLQLLLLKSICFPAFTRSPDYTLVSLQFIFVGGNILPVGEEIIVSMYYPIVTPPPRNLS